MRESSGIDTAIHQDDEQVGGRATSGNPDAPFYERLSLRPALQEIIDKTTRQIELMPHPPKET